MTNQLPTTFSLWGAQFDTKQQEIVGWLLFSITLYFYLHFIAVAGIEISKWIQPFYEAVITRNRLIKNPEFDNTDWMALFSTDGDKSMEERAKKEAFIHVQKKLRHLNNLVYLKLIIEILLPFVVGLIALTLLVKLITSVPN